MKDHILLSSSGFKNINIDNAYTNINDGFTFIAGAKQFQLKRIWADFISPRVSQLHFSDPTLTSVHLDKILIDNPYNEKFLKILAPDHFTRLKDNNNDETKIKSSYYSYLFSDDIIQDIQSLATGNPVEIDSTAASKLRIISFLFENEELLEIINEKYPFIHNNSTKSIKIHLDECIDYLLSTHYLILDNTIIEYISKHFYAIDTSKLLLLPKSVLLSIISHPNLVLKNEDKLYNLIEDLFKEPSEEIENNIDGNPITKVAFYEFLDFTTLSNDLFNNFVESFDPNSMSSNLWKKLTNCFYLSRNKTMSTRNSSSKKTSRFSVEFDGSQSNRFKGIISKLTNDFNGNIHDKKIAFIAASTVNPQFDQPKCVADLNRFSYFQSQNNLYSWICFDFQESMISPSAYSIRSRYDFGPGGNHLMNWKVEGSNDSIKWTVLDERTNEQSLNDRNVANTFQITNNTPKNYFRYIRISQTDMESSGMYYMTLSAIEFFGDFILRC